MNTEITSQRQANIIENLQYVLAGVNGDLRRLPRNHHDRSFLEAQRESVLAKIEEIQSQQVKTVSRPTAVMTRAHEIRRDAAQHFHCEKCDILFGECLKLAWWENTVGGRVEFSGGQSSTPEAPEPVPPHNKEQHKELPFSVCQPETSTQMIDKLTAYLEQAKREYRGRTDQELFYHEIGASGGKVLRYKTLYHVITQGIPSRVRGLTSLKKERDTQRKVDGLLYLVAVLLVAERPVTLTMKPIFHLEQMTSEDREHELQKFFA